MLQIQKGQIIVNGKVTIDPVLIGLAVLDAAEEHGDEVGVLTFYPVYNLYEKKARKSKTG